MTSETYSQVRDVLNRSRRFHLRLAEVYRRVASSSEDEERRELMEHLASREGEMEKLIGSYLEREPSASLDLWLQYTPELDLEAELGRIEGLEGAQWEEIQEAVRRSDESLLGLYAQLAAARSSPGAVELFSSLVQAQEAKQQSAAAASSAGIDGRATRDGTHEGV